MSEIFFEETKSGTRGIYTPKKSLLEKWLFSKGISRFQYILFLVIIFLITTIFTFIVIRDKNEESIDPINIENIDQRKYETNL